MINLSYSMFRNLKKKKKKKLIFNCSYDDYAHYYVLHNSTQHSFLSIERVILFISDVLLCKDTNKKT